MKTNPNDFINPQEERTSQYSETPNTLMYGGLTKREYLAAMAMQGLCACAIAGNHKHFKNLAEEAVLYADALIAELNKGEER